MENYEVELKDNAVIHNPEKAAEQVLSVLKHGSTKSLDGKEVQLSADSFCIHGDNPNAVEILKAIDRILSNNHIQKKAFGKR